MKKKLVYMLIIIEIIIILIDTTFPRFIYADTMSDIAGNTKYEDVQKKMEEEKGAESTYKIFDEGKAKVESAGGTRDEELREVDSASDTIAGTLCSLFVVVPSVINAFMTILTSSFQKPKTVVMSTTGTKIVDDSSGEIEGATKTRKVGEYFLIEDLVMNRYTLFDINYLDLSLANNSTIGELRKNVASWYYSIRNIAIVANCLILVYIGIRMAMSTVAADTAKYKKMFVSWITSFVFIFIMHYIIAILFEIQGFFTEFIGTLVADEGFEETIIKDTFEAVKTARGWDAVGYTITVYVLVYYQLKFFLMYFKRTLAVGFLFEVSPLITITYSIDAVKDGKSQIFNKWFREISFNIFIQLVHALVYAVFIISAGEIAKQAPIMGAILLMALSRAEKIIEKTFKLSSRITKSESIIEKMRKMKI